MKRKVHISIQSISQLGTSELKFVPVLIAVSSMGTLRKKRKNSIEYEANEQYVLLKKKSKCHPAKYHLIIFH